MLHFLSLLTIGIVVLSGIYVLARGEWHPFALKFAGVALSTSAAMWLLGADIFMGGGIATCPFTDPSVCLTVDVYHIVRNIAFVLFHIAIGRDAIHYKRNDRRGTACQKNILKRSPL